METMTTNNEDQTRALGGSAALYERGNHDQKTGRWDGGLWHLEAYRDGYNSAIIETCPPVEIVGGRHPAILEGVTYRAYLINADGGLVFLAVEGTMTRDQDLRGIAMTRDDFFQSCKEENHDSA
jgi:hypothetical protein